VSICGHSHDRISWSILTKIGTDVRTPISKNEFVGVNIAPPLPPFCHKTPILGQEVLKIHTNIKSSYICLKCMQIAKILCPWGNRGRGTRWQRQTLDWKWKYGHFVRAQWKICNITLIYGRMDKISVYWRKSRSRNTMVMSDFRAGVEIWPFRACTMHPAIIIGTVRSLWTWLWGRYHIPWNLFLVIFKNHAD